jgi:hypothetical protein
MLPRVVALCGKKRSGKDTVADYLAATHGYTPAKFAAPLKGALKELFGFTQEQIEESKDVVDAFWGVSPRTVMQFVGSEVIQHEFQKILPDVGRAFFVKSLMARHANDRYIVISDVRFSHEVEAIRKLPGSVVIKLSRPDVDDGDDHISETESDGFAVDCVIENSGSVLDLYAAVERFIETKK